MIDHLIRCATAEHAEALIARFGPSRAMACRVVLTEAVHDTSDPAAPVVVEPEQVADGHHVWVALDALDESLRELPDAACRLIADREAALRGEAFIAYVAADVDGDTLASARVDPVVAGARYPFAAMADRVVQDADP
jgi:hypothetical protein